ncbi:MAG: DNA internalization-related competence protein ComEC/Rec2 [Candidatus Brocadia sp.]|nr:DNA internalization-related competence protein ComEC/Rec2 [Candidatus Brocadia sp.]
MQRPVVFITLLLICGIYAGSLTKIPIYFTIGTGLLLWVFCFIFIYSYKFRIFFPPCLSIFFTVVSTAYYDSRTDFLPTNHVEYVLTTRKSLQRITGVIINPPVLLDKNTLNKRLLQVKSGQISRKSHYKISFTIRAEGIETASGWKEISGIMKVNLYPSEEEILKADNTSPIINKLVYGQRVTLFGYAFLPNPPDNPYEFDYKSYLQRQMPSVRCLMTVVNMNNIQIKDSYRNNWVYGFIYALNNSLNNTIYTYTFSNSAPLISSMLLGNRVDLPNETIDNFMKTGIIHFIAISGFNVGIVIFTVLLPLRFLGINQTLSTLIILFIVALYTFLTGLNPPVLRASIMAVVFFCSFLVHRQWDITCSIFTAIFFILIRNPSDLFNIGFQLSVLATMGIVYGSSKIEGTLFKTALFIETLQVKAERGRLFFLKKYLRKSFCVSLAAWLATLPLTAYYFHLFTPFISITNIIVFPLFWIIIVCGIVLLTLGMVCPPLASVSAWLASNADMVLESLVSNLASLPYSYFYVSGPSPAETIAYYLFIILLLYRNFLSIDLVKIAIFGLLSANILIFSGMLKFANRSLKITCLDVGHGSAIVIQFPTGKNILYDVGSWQNYDIGKNIVAPFLWGQHIKKIDLVIISHEHEDHFSGLSSIIERFQVKSVYSQQHLFSSEEGQRILTFLRKKRIRTAALSSGEVLKGFEPAVVKIIHPPFVSGITPTNDNSCVIKIEYHGYSVLLCADIEERGIGSILSKSSEIRADIIQVPHHGSSINNMEEFLNTVQPAYAFINSSDGITSLKTLDILQKHHIMVLQTHREGAITFNLDKNGITYSSFLNKALHIERRNPSIYNYNFEIP